MSFDRFIKELVRSITPSKNPSGIHAALMLIWIVIQAWSYGKPVGSPTIYLPAISAALAWITRTQVTPITDPKDGNGNKLIPLLEPLGLPDYPARAIRSGPVGGGGGIGTQPGATGGPS